MPGHGGPRSVLPRLPTEARNPILLALGAPPKLRGAPAGRFSERPPRLYGHLAVCFGREIENDFGCIDVGLDVRAAVGRAAVVDLVVQLTEATHLVLGVPADALAAVAKRVSERPQ